MKHDAASPEMKRDMIKLTEITYIDNNTAVLYLCYIYIELYIHVDEAGADRSISSSSSSFFVLLISALEAVLPLPIWLWCSRSDSVTFGTTWCCLVFVVSCPIPGPGSTWGDSRGISCSANRLFDSYVGITVHCSAYYKIHFIGMLL